MRYFMPYRLQSSVTNSHATSSILSCLIFCIDTKQILRYNCVKGSLKCLQLVKFQRHNFIKCKIRPFFRYFEFLFAKQGENMNNPKRITLKHLLLSFSSMSIKLLHIGLPIILIYLLALLTALLSASNLPSNVLSHLYLSSLEHITMAFTIIIVGAFTADLAERHSKQ